MSSTKRVRLLLTSLAAFAGFVLGVITAPDPASAITLNVAGVNPGPASTTGTMGCIWHGLIDACGTTGDATALDWNNSSGSGVHFREWTFRGAGTGTAYLATKSINNSNCRRVQITLHDVADVLRGAEYFTHTALYGGDRFVYYITGATSYYYTSNTIGTTVSPYPNGDLSTCTSDGPHLHQGAAVSPARNTGTYTGTGGQRDITVNAKWQHEWSWWE